MPDARWVPPNLGWKRDSPDFRDYTPGSPVVQAMLAKLEPVRERPSAVDLREFFPPAVHQGGLNSSCAHACVALYEYMQRRVHGDTESYSAAFVYKTTRTLLRQTGDNGADLRSTLKSLVRFGLPPQAYYPQQPQEADAEPAPFLYCFRDGFAAMRYVRLDICNATGYQTLELTKSSLAAGIPCVFGFSVPASISVDADIPYRFAYDKVRGGMAAVAVGYDDKRIATSVGALLFRCSWGREWGEGGYGWLPYHYVERQIAVDFWVLLAPDWLDSGLFRHPWPDGGARYLHQPAESAADFTHADPGPGIRPD